MRYTKSVGKQASKADRAQFLKIWLELPDEQFAEILDSLRKQWMEDVHRSFKSSPSALERKLTEAEEAFSLFYRIKRLLSLPLKPAEEVDWMQKAREDFRAKRYSEALGNFQKAIATGVPSPDDLVLAGTCALYAGRLDYAQSFADQALRIDENEIQALVLKALACYRKEDFKESYAYLLKARSIREDHPAVLKCFPLVERALSAPVEVKSRESDVKLKRRWLRKRVNYHLVVNDYEQLSAMTVRVCSLSAGGCLIDSNYVPEQFDFILEMDGGKQVSGTARRIYETELKQIGLRFLNLNPRDEDLINQHLVAIAN